MATRKTVADWDRLSPAYKQRLLNHGYTLQDYLTGASRQSARGHARTPERPERAARNPARFPEYVAKRVTDYSNLRQRILSKAEPYIRMNAPRRFDIGEVEFNVDHASPDTLRLMDSITMEEWFVYASVAAGGTRDEKQRILSGWEFAYYDDTSNSYVNPFWYH